MSKIIPLFVSYFYPPAGGTGLPGSQRTVKFIRYLQGVEKKIVLTLETDCYSKELLLNFDLPLPINGETIVRTKAVDRFVQVMRLRNIWRKKTNNGIREKFENGRLSKVPVEIPSRKKNGKSLQQKIKDFIYHYYYYPDQIAGPWLKTAVRTGVRLVRKNNVNIIFATGMPWTALEVGRRISRRTGVPFIADFRDPWIGNPFLQSKGLLLDWRDRLCEKRIVEQAAIVSANTLPLQKEFWQRYPDIDETKIIYLPNGFDRNDFLNLPISNDRKTHTDKLILVHAGYLYGKRDPAPLLDALQLATKIDPELADFLEFRQIGGISLGYNIEKVYNVLYKKGVVKFLGQVPFVKCLTNLMEADILVIIQPGTKTQIPSKLYDYLCINRPILTITPSGGALDVLIRQNKFGDIFTPEQSQDLAYHLIDLVRKKQAKKLDFSPNYPGKEQYDIQHITKLLEKRMLEVINRGA